MGILQAANAARNVWKLAITKIILFMVFGTQLEFHKHGSCISSTFLMYTSHNKDCYLKNCTKLN